MDKVKLRQQLEGILKDAEEHPGRPVEIIIYDGSIVLQPDPAVTYKMRGENLAVFCRLAIKGLDREEEKSVSSELSAEKENKDIL